MCHRLTPQAGMSFQREERSDSAMLSPLGVVIPASLVCIHFSDEVDKHRIGPAEAQRSAIEAVFWDAADVTDIVLLNQGPAAERVGAAAIAEDVSAIVAPPPAHHLGLM